MQLPFIPLLSALLFAFVAQAQFQFFEQMFQGQQQHQQQGQQPQNVGSGSEWYQQTYQEGKALRLVLYPYVGDFGSEFTDGICLR